MPPCDEANFEMRVVRLLDHTDIFSLDDKGEKYARFGFIIDNIYIVSYKNNNEYVTPTKGYSPEFDFEKNEASFCIKGLVRNTRDDEEFAINFKFIASIDNYLNRINKHIQNVENRKKEIADAILKKDNEFKMIMDFLKS